MKTKLFFIAMSLLALVGCDIHTPIEMDEHPSDITFGTFKDTRDGYTYKTVTIGGQTWMAENLRYCPNEAITDTRLRSSIDPYYYIYTSIEEPDTKKNFEKYGIIYNYKAAMKAAPDGWRLPTSGDFYELMSTVRNMKGCYNDYDLMLMLMAPEDLVWDVEKNFPYVNCTGFSGQYCRHYVTPWSWETYGRFYSSTDMEYWIDDNYLTGCRTFRIYGGTDSYLNGTETNEASDGYPIRCIKK